MADAHSNVGFCKCMHCAAAHVPPKSPSDSPGHRNGKRPAAQRRSAAKARRRPAPSEAEAQQPREPRRLRRVGGALAFRRPGASVRNPREGTDISQGGTGAPFEPRAARRKLRRPALAPGPDKAPCPHQDQFPIPTHRGASPPVTHQHYVRRNHETNGDPVMTLRLPAWMISGLKQVALKEDTSVSALIREMVGTCLDQHGIHSDADRPIDGQCSMDV